MSSKTGKNFSYKIGFCVFFKEKLNPNYRFPRQLGQLLLFELRKMFVKLVIFTFTSLNCGGTLQGLPNLPAGFPSLVNALLRIVVLYNFLLSHYGALFTRYGGNFCSTILEPQTNNQIRLLKSSVDSFKSQL